MECHLQSRCHLYEGFARDVQKWVLTSEVSYKGQNYIALQVRKEIHGKEERKHIGKHQSTWNYLNIK